MSDDVTQGNASVANSGSATASDSVTSSASALTGDGMLSYVKYNEHIHERFMLEAVRRARNNRMDCHKVLRTICNSRQLGWNVVTGHDFVRAYYQRLQQPPYELFYVDGIQQHIGYGIEAACIAAIEVCRDRLFITELTPKVRKCIHVFNTKIPLTHKAQVWLPGAAAGYRLISGSDIKHMRSCARLNRLYVCHYTQSYDKPYRVDNINCSQLTVSNSFVLVNNSQLLTSFAVSPHNGDIATVDESGLVAVYDSTGSQRYTFNLPPEFIASPMPSVLLPLLDRNDERNHFLVATLKKRDGDDVMSLVTATIDYNSVDGVATTHNDVYWLKPYVSLVGCDAETGDRIVVSTVWGQTARFQRFDDQWRETGCRFAALCSPNALASYDLHTNLACMHGEQDVYYIVCNESFCRVGVPKRP